VSDGYAGMLKDLSFGSLECSLEACRGEGLAQVLANPPANRPPKAMVKPVRLTGTEPEMRIIPGGNVDDRKVSD
jgi:hypothetical protein